ncbi:c-type cytochrome [bacterium]|nr:c-type cytochrome [bacterium]
MEKDEAAPLPESAPAPAPAGGAPARSPALRVFLVVLSVVTVTVLGGAIAIYARSERRAKVKARTFSVPRTLEQVDRGRYLVSVACVFCHGDDLGGGKELTNPLVRAWASNLTADAATGLGAWKDGLVEEALRRGVRPDGRILRAPMPVYTRLADEDLFATIAYLRSAAPVSRPSRLPEPTLEGRIAFARMKHPPHGIAAGLVSPPRGTTAEYGRYLAEEVLRCGDCHDPRGKGAAAPPGWSGGMRFDSPAPAVLASNISSDEIEGIGKWSQGELARALRDGVNAAGRKLHEAMPRYPLADPDVGAVFAFLRSLPAARRHVLSPLALAGSEAYSNRGCVSCHGQDGKGPRSDITKLGATGDLAKIKAWVKDPQSVKAGTDMPTLKIDDERELEAISEYVVELAR